MELEGFSEVAPDERPGAIKGFGKRGALHPETVVQHLQLLFNLNTSGIFPTSFRPWLPRQYRSEVYYHRDVLDEGLVEMYPRFQVTAKGRELCVMAG